MCKVFVCSRSFGFGAELHDLTALFRDHGLTPVFGELNDGSGALAEAEGLVVGMNRVDRAVLDRAPRLRAVIKYGVGTENIDRAAARDRGVEVLNLPGINADSVAELALALMLACSRRVIQGAQAVREGGWPKMLGNNLRGKTLGIVGTGAIGLSLLRLVSGFEMTVLGYDLRPNGEFVRLGGVYLALDRLLEQADVVSLHLPLTESTRHLIGEAQLERMKPTAILVNTARGPVVDEEALARALREKRIAGAGLDVLEHEPAARSPLIGLEGAVITPHMAAYTEETLRRMDEACVRKLAEALGARSTVS